MDHDNNGHHSTGATPPPHHHHPPLPKPLVSTQCLDRSAAHCASDSYRKQAVNVSVPMPSTRSSPADISSGNAEVPGTCCGV
jgi:hypothetical protein